MVSWQAGNSEHLEASFLIGRLVEPERAVEPETNSMVRAIGTSSG